MAVEKTASTRIVRLPLGNLHQGIISDVNPVEAPVGSCVVGTNNVVWVDGFLRSRAGFQVAYPRPSTDRIHKLLVHQDRAGNNLLCAITLNSTTGIGTFYKFVTVTSLWTVVGTIPDGQVNVAFPMTFCNFAGVTYFTTGQGDIWYFDPQHYLGTVVLGTLTSLQPLPTFKPPESVKILVAGDARLIAANYYWDGLDTPYGVAWSDFLGPKTWGGAIANQGGDSGGTALPKNSDPITGMYVNSSVLTVFRPREIYIGVEVGSPATYKVSCFDQGPGCVAHATIQPYRDGAIVWLGDDNVYIGAPGQQPIPLGDHIRLRIRQVSSLGLLAQAKALLDYDHQLYTLFLPDATTGLNTKLFTCNLRNGSWWEGAVADLGMAITDAIAYRSNPWQTLNLVGTSDGRILQYSLGYSQDDQTTFPCNWTSSILPVRNFFGPEHEQASIQTLRVIGKLAAPSPVEQVTFSLQHGNGIDHMATTNFTPNQVLGGDPNALLMAYERVTAEFFQLTIGATSGSLFPLVAQVELGAIGQGMTR